MGTTESLILAQSTMEPEVLQHVLGRLGFRCSVEEAAATIESIVCGALTSAHLEMISQGDTDRPPIRLTDDEFVLAVTSVADQPPISAAAAAGSEAEVDTFLAEESEPDWSSTFVVGKYLAALVEATPEVQARRAAEAAVEAARKNGQVDQALAISPFWAMRPHELRGLADNLDTPAAAKARAERPLKSELVRLLVESEIYTRARAASHKAGGTIVPTRTMPPKKKLAPKREAVVPYDPPAAENEEKVNEGGLGGWMKKRSKWMRGDGDRTDEEPIVTETNDLRRHQSSTAFSKDQREQVPGNRSTLESVRSGVNIGAAMSTGRGSSFAQRAISKVGKPQSFNKVLR